MTASENRSDRDVVPRWRSFGLTVLSRETEPFLRFSRERFRQDLSELEANFEEMRGPYSASDLVGAALVGCTSSKMAEEAANLLVASELSSPGMRELGRALLADRSSLLAEPAAPSLDSGRMRRRVHLLRQIVIREPRNAVRWTDLALAHTVLGSADQAEKAMRVALGLAGSNRFILRAAARLYIHLERPDDAHRLLTRDPTLLADPWLAATEMATAEVAKRPSIAIRRARGMIREESGISPWHLSELASEFAMAEARAGHARPARRLMELALREPTDNALAQAEWASSQGLIWTDPHDLDLPRTYEARALRHAAEGDWGLAAEAGFHWLEDQPFAIEAARFTSFAASVGAEDYRLAEQASRAGLVANSGDALLRNNLAFALANQGQVAGASAELAQLDTSALSAQGLSVVTATSGFLRFRSGDPRGGRELYQRAVETAKRAQLDEVARLACVFWAREELLTARSPESDRGLLQALTTAQSSGERLVKLWIDRLKEIAASQARFLPG